MIFLVNVIYKNDYIIFDLNQNEVKIEEIKKRIIEVDQDLLVLNFYLVKKNHELTKLFKKDE